ncbi:hypothetical protein HK104_007863, partial [Borealophlyctis nickersoniae]
MLYRREQQRTIRAAHPHISNNRISTIVGEMWRNEVEDVKNEFRRRAAQGRAVHYALYPDYQYTPPRNPNAPRRSRTGGASSSARSSARRSSHSTSTRRASREQQQQQQQDGQAAHHHSLSPQTSPAYAPTPPTWPGAVEVLSPRGGPHSASTGGSSNSSEHLFDPYRIHQGDQNYQAGGGRYADSFGWGAANSGLGGERTGAEHSSSSRGREGFGGDRLDVE